MPRSQSSASLAVCGRSSATFSSRYEVRHRGDREQAGDYKQANLDHGAIQIEGLQMLRKPLAECRGTKDVPAGACHML